MARVSVLARGIPAGRIAIDEGAHLKESVDIMFVKVRLAKGRSIGLLSHVFHHRHAWRASRCS